MIFTRLHKCAVFYMANNTERSKEVRAAMAHQMHSHGLTFMGGNPVSTEDYSSYHVTTHVSRPSRTNQEPLMGQTPGDASVQEQIAARQGGLKILNALGVNTNKKGSF